MLAGIVLATGLMAAAPPVPKPKPLQQAQTAAETPPGQQQAAPDKRGNEESPFVVKLTPAQQSAPGRNNNSNAGDKSSANWFLVLVGLLQLGVFGWQGFQLKGAVDATNRAAEIAQREFVSTHRPKIILREAFIGNVLEDEPISVTMQFANIGETRSIIVHSLVDVQIRSTESEHFNLHGTPHLQNEIGTLALGSGEARSMRWVDLHKPNANGPPPRWKESQFATIKVRSARNRDGVATTAMLPEASPARGHRALVPSLPSRMHNWHAAPPWSGPCHW